MTFVVHFEPIVPLSDDQFFEFCQRNRDARMERNVEIILQPL